MSSAKCCPFRRGLNVLSFIQETHKAILENVGKSITKIHEEPIMQV